MSKTGLTFSKVEAQIAVDTPADFEPHDGAGKPSGYFLKLLSDQHPKVRDGLTAIANGQRKRAAFTAEQARHSRPGETFIPVEDDIDDSVKGVALRIAGWRASGQTEGLTAEQIERFDGIDEEFSPANAVKLLKLIPSWAQQITNETAKMASFIKASPKTS
jgi:hypothetical protein